MQLRREVQCTYDVHTVYCTVCVRCDVWWDIQCTMYITCTCNMYMYMWSFMYNNILREDHSMKKINKINIIIHVCTTQPNRIDCLLVWLLQYSSRFSSKVLATVESNRGMNFICCCVLLLHGLLNVRLTKNNAETIFICFFPLERYSFFDFLIF